MDVLEADDFKNYLGDYKRRMRSLHQRIYLLTIHVFDNNLVKLDVMGSSRNIYTITITYVRNTDHEIVSNTDREIVSNTDREIVTDSFNTNREIDDVIDDESVIVECNCPDSTLTKHICKHIYWLGIKQFGVTYPKYWKRRHIDEFICRHISKYKNRDGETGRNDTCPICFEEINYGNQLTLQCKEQCRNSFHTLCWKKYYFTSYSDKCVICRSNFYPFEQSNNNNK